MLLYRRSIWTIVMKQTLVAIKLGESHNDDEHMRLVAGLIRPAERVMSEVDVYT